MLQKIKVIQKTELATLFVAQTQNRPDEPPVVVEFVSTGQPGVSKLKKWVLIVSTMAGCPVRCKFCDAGGDYRRKLDRSEILDQILQMIDQQYPDRKVATKQLKVHFGRMGEPAFNNEVLAVLRVLPQTLLASGLFPSISTVGPASDACRVWYEQLRDIKNQYYQQSFQLQFSVHSTDESVRRYLIPIHLLPLSELAKMGEKFFRSGERKITLNFALMDQVRVDPDIIAHLFDPQVFFVKLTPMNPTKNAARHHLRSAITSDDLSVADHLQQQFKQLGFDALLSWGADEENLIQTNCGQFASRYENHVRKT